MVIQAEIEKDPLQINEYCDNKNEEMIDVHPDLIDVSSKLDSFKSQEIFVWSQEFFNDQWYLQNRGGHFVGPTSPWVHQLS